jgi:hypothetical protein
VDADDSPTKEDIFPKNIFGFVITKNCCKRCNSRLGNAVDLKLPADERIILAAREAGIKEAELLPQYSGVGLDSLNRQARYTVKDGKHRFNPNFHQQGFSIGMIDGEVFPNDLQNAKAKMRSLVEADKSLHLTPEEITQYINDLFNQFIEKFGKKKFIAKKLNKGLTPSPDLATLIWMAFTNLTKPNGQSQKFYMKQQSCCCHLNYSQKFGQP